MRLFGYYIIPEINKDGGFKIILVILNQLKNICFITRMFRCRFSVTIESMYPISIWQRRKSENLQINLNVEIVSFTCECIAIFKDIFHYSFVRVDAILICWSATFFYLYKFLKDYNRKYCIIFRSFNILETELFYLKQLNGVFLREKSMIMSTAVF